MKKNMKEIMTAAHKMTKEIKAAHSEVDYSFQLGLCISYLYNKEEEMVKLQGSEKQIAWATEIRNNNIAMFEKSIESFKLRETNGTGSFPELIKNLEKSLNSLKNDKTITASASWWIGHKKVAESFIDRLIRAEQAK